jgi:hypothetical protein
VQHSDRTPLGDTCPNGKCASPPDLILNGNAAWVRCQTNRPSAWVQCQPIRPLPGCMPTILARPGRGANFRHIVWSCTKCVVTSDVIWAVCAIAALSKKRAFPCSYPGHLPGCSAKLIGHLPGCSANLFGLCLGACQLSRPDRLGAVPLHLIAWRTIILILSRYSQLQIAVTVVFF